MKAFLGTGLLGSGFITAMLEKGEDVHIWNRTLSKAKALEGKGAKVFESPAAAVKNADRIHIVLKDDESIDEVLEQALPGMKKGAIIVDHTTTSVSGAKRRTKRWAEKRFQYLHAPVLMGPGNARQGTGFMLVSGDQDLIAQLTPTLSAMTGKLMNFGDETGKAAAMKLCANLFLIALNGGISDTMALAHGTGITIDELLTLFADWNPGEGVTGRIKKVQKDDFSDPSWELSMARKDAGLMIDESKEAGIPLMVIPAIAAKMDELIGKGLGSKDWSIIAKKPSTTK